MKVFPVIHFQGRELALEEAARARDCGADGVFLISHLGDDDLLVQVAVEAQAALPGFPVGINLLSRTAEQAVQAALAHDLPMVWADRMGVSSAGLTEEGRRLSALRQATPSLELFASVAFKYQPYEALPVRAAELALAAGFIPTTSGAGTGKAPDLAKISRMSAATHGTLAVASGMTPENIAAYAGHLSHCLVATGISLDEHRMDERKLRRFIAQSQSRAG